MSQKSIEIKFYKIAIFLCVGKPLLRWFFLHKEFHEEFHIPTKKCTFNMIRHIHVVAIFIENYIKAAPLPHVKCYSLQLFPF